MNLKRFTEKSARDWAISIGRVLLRPFPDAVYLAVGHFCYHGTWPNYRHPRSFTEHIQEYMLRCRDPLLRIAADKAASRDFIAQRVGAEYLMPLLGVWDRAEDVPLASLPRPCVLKPTAASGLVVFLREGDRLDEPALRATMRDWLRRDYSRLHREWCYIGVPRRLMAEAMLREPDGSVPPDYKVYVLGGVVRMLQVDRGRFGRHTRNVYDSGWNPLPARWSLEKHAPDPRPACLTDMLRLSETLAQGFEFLRVDFYWCGGRLYVGELTNYPGAGFEKFIPAEYSYVMGSFWPAPAQRPPARETSTQNA